MTGQAANWTILTYIAAHNNLDFYGRRSLAQIRSVRSTPQVKLAALLDGPSGASRMIAGEKGSPDIEESLGNFDSGDPDGLLETIRWTFEQCPAHHYGLILWSHGDGWQPHEIAQVAQQVRNDKGVSDKEAGERAASPGSMSFFRSSLETILRKDNPSERAVLFDDGSGHSLDTLELEQVVTKANKITGKNLDLLGMDACLMATLEMSYQVRKLADYFVASEELVPGASWPYDTILGKLQANPQMTARDLAGLIVSDYMAYYTAHVPPFGGGDVTKVALDLSRIDELRTAADRLAAAILSDMDGQAQALWTAQMACYQQESQQEKRKSSKFRIHQWDLGTLSKRLASDDARPEVKAAAEALQAALQPGGAVVAEGHLGDWFDGLRGVSAYLMAPGKQRISPYYCDVAFAQDTHWLQMLQAYALAAA